ncbi:MAG TPA: penicillin-binding transpeptidase domain-containing protein [Nitrospinota bacterium]|nr:penicillin-binding transpeptidase domain-containing protein [Nitrospinota bacterium]
MLKHIEDKLNKRIIFFSLLITVCFLTLAVKLYYIQVLKHDEFFSKAKDQYQRFLLLEPKRGTIYDRNMKELAVSIELDSIYLNPKEIDNPKETIQKLSKVINIKKSEILKSLKEKKNFVWVKRKIEPEKAKKIKEFNIKGAGFIKEYKRFYPKRGLAGHVIGFVGTDNKGLEGLEYLHDDSLRGESRQVLIERDALGRNLYLKDIDSRYPLIGYDLILTIDEVIQYIAEKELKRQVIETDAKRGIIIIMDPYSGEILALSETPGFNPNIFVKYDQFIWRNRAITTGYEPGSTFKIIAAAAALEENKVNSEELIFCENGKIELGGLTIRDHQEYGWLRFEEIIQKSSNIGAIKTSQRLGKVSFYDYIRKFGFGDKTGIGLPGEIPGLIRAPKDWSNVSIGAISIGQEILITPIQLINAVSLIANGGVLVKPRILKAVSYKNKIIKETQRKEIRRVISYRTSKIMSKILKGAVNNGTGNLAAVKGFSVAGKTGTAQKFDPIQKAYSKDKYLASFVGFVPAEEPKIVVLVIIDEPKDIFWGGKVAAPVFSRVAQQVLRYLMIPQNENMLYVKYDNRIKKDKNEIESSLENGFFSNISNKIMTILTTYLNLGKEKVVYQLEKDKEST